MSAAEVEPLGHLTFGTAEGGKIVATTDLDAWLASAQTEWHLKEGIAPLLNMDDQALEAHIRDGDWTPDEWLDFVDVCHEWRTTHEAGAQVFGAVEARLFVVLDRLYGSEARPE